MTAGVPGSGIGGSFYLLSALLMPVQETVMILRRKSSKASRKAVCRQVLNAIGVMWGVWMTGWFITKSVSKISSVISPGQERIVTAISWINMVYGMLTLLAVFIFIQVLSFITRAHKSEA